MSAPKVSYLAELEWYTGERTVIDCLKEVIEWLGVDALVEIECVRCDTIEHESDILLA